MFDIAINGMGLVGGDTFNFQNIDYSHFVPLNKPEFYHPYCAMDFSSDVSCDNVPPFPPSILFRDPQIPLTCFSGQR